MDERIQFGKCLHAAMMKAQKLNFDMCLYSVYELSAGIKIMHMSAFFILVFHCIEEKNYIDNHK